MRTVSWEELARRDLAEAMLWYSENTGVSEESFDNDVTATIERICELPFAAARMLDIHNVRARKLVGKLPYRLIYEVTDEAIHITRLRIPVAIPSTGSIA